MAAPVQSHPDLILYNATIATQNPRQPMAQALAVVQGRIMAVGKSDEMLNIASADTEKIDLDGRLMVPGFIDAHIHFYEWSLQRQGVQLSDLKNLDTLLDRLRETADKRPAGQWIMGQGWNETDWTKPTMPSRNRLDRAVPNHPVLLWRCDLHLAAANSAALALAGIDATTSDPPDGCIERDDKGAPTGILRELAINLVRDVVKPPKMNQVLDAFQDGAAALHRRGVTGIHDVRLMSDQDGARAFQAFQKLDAGPRLPLRAWVTLPGERLDELVGIGLQTGFGNDRLRIGHVKYFSDGGMGARTAWMIDPYLDAGHGMPMADMGLLADQVCKADAAGLSVMIHAIGDRANRELVNLFETLEKGRAQSGQLRPFIPHRIEHVQMIRPADADRLRNLNVALCVNPANLLLDINLIDSAVGKQGRHTYAFRRLLDTGAPVMFSSDCPVCDPAPLIGIHAAVTRQRADGTPVGGWHPQQRITLPEAIQAYTATPAAVHRASDLGIIAPGKKADMAVLNENILTSDPSGICEAKLDMTVFGGEVVFRQF